MDVKLIKRWLVFVVGLFLLGSGISFTIIAANTLGIGGWDAINTRLNILFPNFSIGNYLIMVAAIVCIVSGVLKAEIPKMHYLIASFLLGYMVDFSLFLIISYIPNINHILSFGIGMLLIAVGTHIYIEADLLLSPIDYFMKAIMYRFKVNIGVAKIVVEVTALIIAFAIKAPISIGTAIMIVGLGPLYSVTEKPIRDIVSKLLA